jgi:hypothetical protein
MEIVIRTEGEQAGLTAPSAAQQPSQETGPPPDVAARAAAVGAIDAGPARLPTGQTGQPAADIGAVAQQQLSAAGGEGAASAGAAPGYAAEPQPTMVEAEGETG